MDLHHNLFYSYRGSSPDNADRERQLENNVTKALINTLRHGGDAVVQPFLSDLGIVGARHVNYLMQRPDLPSSIAAQRPQRLLLGITKHPTNWSPTGKMTRTYPSVPDAWIFGDGFAVLIESKVAGDFYNAQMRAHLARLSAPDRPQPKIALITWGQIHRFFQGVLGSLSGASKLLVEQFVQFLEYSDMSGSAGFRREHFDYFLLHDDDDARRWICDQVNDLAGRIQSRLAELDPFYASYDVGVLRSTDAHCWVGFGPANRKYRGVTHQTISLGADGVHVFVNTELKSATDRLKSALTGAQDALRAALKAMHEFKPFELVLEKRVQRRAAVYDYTPQMRLHSSLLVDEANGDDAWHAFASTVQRLPLLSLGITRQILPGSLIQPEGGQNVTKNETNLAVGLIVNMLRDNHAVVRLLNGS